MMNIPRRFLLILYSTLAVIICYIDRVNISVAIIPMQEQFGWSESQVGLIFSSFYIGYMVTMALGGYLADKFGGKRVLGCGVILWSLFTILTPVAAHNGLFALFFIRILMGVGEGVTFPAWHSLYARWIPFKERTRAIAFTNSGIAIGTIIGYIGTQMIIVSMGWEWAFYLFGIVGLAWFYFWSRGVTSFPSEHKSISSYELSYIEENAPSVSAANKIPLRKLFLNKPFLAIVAATFANNWSLFVFLSFLPKFLDNELGIALESSAFVSLMIVPSIISVLALNAGGFLADDLIKKGRRVIKVRKAVNSIGFFGSASCLFMVPFFESISTIIILICVTNLFSGIAAGGFGVNHADIAPNATGTLVGIASTFGMIAGVIGNIVSGYVLEITESWTFVFHIAASLIVVGGLIYLLFASDQRQFE
jgi:ACS family sodium-dependent inorganic phosphate cotransporter